MMDVYGQLGHYFFFIFINWLIPIRLLFSYGALFKNSAIKKVPWTCDHHDIIIILFHSWSVCGSGVKKVGNAPAKKQRRRMLLASKHGCKLFKVKIISFANVL